MNVWPLTGKPLADLNILLSNWRQYGTFYFIGPDDIDRLFNILTTVGIEVDLDDLGNRPQYWLLQLAIILGAQSPPPSIGDLDFSGSTSSSIAGLDSLPLILSIIGDSTDFGSLHLANLANLSRINFPNLTAMSSSLAITNCPSLNTLSLPLVASIPDVLIFQTGLITVSFPSLVNVPSFFEIDENLSLQSLNLPSLVSIAGDFVCGTGYGDLPSPIQSVNLSSYLPTNGGLIDFGGCALDQASVDQILARGVANPAFISGTLKLSGGTNSAPSSIAPGSDYDILINRGVNVLVNP